MTKILIVDDVKAWREYHRKQVLIEFPEAEIHQCCSAREGYDKLIENNSKPFDIIITDLQMESDFSPKFAGEWFVEQIKNQKNYYSTKIFIVSASYKIQYIADSLNVNYIPKSTAINFPDIYQKLKGN